MLKLLLKCAYNGFMLTGVEALESKVLVALSIVMSPPHSKVTNPSVWA